MKATPLPSQARLKELLDYDPLTGGLVWRVRIANKTAGSPAGRRKPEGYLTIGIDSKQYQAHRIIWAWVTGEDPGLADIDHADLDPSNNCWDNLRLATKTGNMCNREGWSKKGLPKGVGTNRKRFSAQIRVNRVQYYLGTYDTPEEAHQAYCKAATELHQEFACLA